MTQAADLDCSFCSLASWASGEDPIGSAGQSDHFLLFELPLPWPRNTLEARHTPPRLAEVIARAGVGGQKIRVLALQPQREQTSPLLSGRTRVISYRRPPGLWAQLTKREFLLPTPQVAELAAALLEHGDLTSFARYEQDTRQIRDLLTCTHGAVDAACAKFGYPSYQRLRDEFVPESQGRLRAWRTGHFGGHRFAATLIDLPTGRWWAHLDGERLAQVARQRGEVHGLHRHQRGWSGLDFWGQHVERAIFEREGWAWLDVARAGQTLSVDGDAGPTGPAASGTPPARAEVGIDFMRPDGNRGRYRATVEYQDFVLSQSSSGDTTAIRANRYRVSALQCEPAAGPPWTDEC